MPNHPIPPTKPQSFSAIYALIPKDWEEPLLLRINPAYGFHDVEGEQVGFNGDLIDDAIDRFGAYQGLPGYVMGALVLLIRRSDQDGIVLNPMTVAESFTGYAPKRLRAVIWVLQQMKVVE